MATTINIDFTDSQWALVQAHYPYNDPETKEARAISADELKTVMFNLIKADIALVIRNKAVENADVSFE